MGNYKRKKPRTQVKCVLCTPHREGNSLSAIKAKYRQVKMTKEIFDTD